MNDEIRREAERLAAESAAESPPPEPRDPEALIHELKVHQIELEIQNEELRTTQYGLEAARTEYADLYHHAPVGYLTADADGVIRRCNQTFRRMLNRPDEVLTDKPLSSLMTADGKKIFLGRFKAFFRRPEGKILDISFRLPAADPIILQISGHRPEGGDQVNLALVDVTVQREATRTAQELAMEKDLLLRELRHRTQNNLQSVISLLSLQGSVCESDEAVSALERAQERVQTMMHLQDSLSFAAKDAAVDLERYLKELLRRTAEIGNPERRIAMESAVEAVTVNASSAATIGIICNEALTNIYKHAFPDGAAGRVALNLRRKDQFLELSISDNGAGSASAPPRPGSGLGRMLMEAMADQLGGTIEIDQSEAGTTVWLAFPLH